MQSSRHVSAGQHIIRSFASSRHCEGFGLAKRQRREDDEKEYERHPPSYRAGIPPHLRYTPPTVDPDVSHPSYRPGEVIRFKDPAAKYPPARAVQRHDRLKRARELNVSHHVFNKPQPERPDYPDVPVTLEDKRDEGKVDYEVGRVGVTNERRDFFDEAVEKEAEWVQDGEVEEGIPGLDVGRIVEVRRSGQMSIGMILASIVISGKPRLLLLRSNGEVWPISSRDVQFVMPAALVSPTVAGACWTPQLLDLYAKGEEPTGPELDEAMEPMNEARRKAVMVIRRISRETEKMCGKMMSGIYGRGGIGGVEAVWDKWAPDEAEARGSITAIQAAEYILNHDSNQTIVVKSNTLPAYSAHVLMMRRPDLFLADAGDMWESERFMVRSRAERQRLADVSRLVEASSEEDKRTIVAFVDKARYAVAESKRAKEVDPDSNLRDHKHALPDWTPTEISIISTIFLRLFEDRTTQTNLIDPLAASLMKLIGVYPESILGYELIPSLMQDLGVLPPTENIQRSEIAESERRAMAMSGVTPRGEGELLAGNELDDLREDFTQHKVFVVDDPTASELDDGIAVEKIPGSEDVWIHVLVADPTRYIPFDHPIAIQASFRGSSLYLPGGSVPLFPLEVIMKELSLGALGNNGAQGVMTFSAKLTQSGDVSDSRVRMGWIKNPRVTTYGAVDKALGVEKAMPTRPFGTPIGEGKARVIPDIASEDLEDLQLLQRFASALRTRRFANAGLDYNTAGSSIRIVSPLPFTPSNMFDPTQLSTRPTFYSGSPVIDYTVSSGSPSSMSATAIIAEFMIMAGRTAASFCGSRGIPVPYRISGKPQSTVLPGQRTTTMEDVLARRDAAGMVSPWDIASSNLLFTPGGVGFSPGQHWVMGFDDQNGYVRATSPLRRFDDMVIHWQIKATLAKEKRLDTTLAPALSKENVEDLVKRCDPAQRKAKKASNFADAWWQAGLFASRLRNPRPQGYQYDDQTLTLGEAMTAIIAGPTVYGTLSPANTTPVFIPSLGATARLPGTGKTLFKIGDEVGVRITNAEQWPAPITDVQSVD